MATSVAGDKEREPLTYDLILYTWHHEPQNLYQARHITIYDAVQVITRNDSVVSSQSVGDEERYKHIGLSPAGIIVVITDHTETRIITAWHASTAQANSTVPVEKYYETKEEY